MISLSTSAFYRNAATKFAELRTQTGSLQVQIATGQRLERSSDDPVAAAQLRQLARADAWRKVDTENAQRAATDLALADDAMGSMADYVIRARELATQATASTLTAQQRGFIGRELTSIREGLLSLANARDSAGHALFGGETDQQAYALDPATGTIGYVGTASPDDIGLGDGQSVTRSVIGPQFLTFQTSAGTTDLFAAVGALADAMSAPSADPIAAASEAVTTLDKGLQAVTTAQTVVGARLNWIDFNTSRLERQSELSADEEARVGGADLAGAITRLQHAVTVLEASQSSFAKLAGLSLFSVID